MARVGDRWDRRMDTHRDGREPITVQSAAMVLATPQAVWDFLQSPGSGVLLDSKHLRTFPVPGTPEEGVGHQFCKFRLRDGDGLSVSVYENVEYDPPHRIVRKLLNFTTPYIEGLTLAEVPGGCSLLTSVGMRIAAGSASRVGPEIQRNLDEQVAKIKGLVEACAS